MPVFRKTRLSVDAEAPRCRIKMKWRMSEEDPTPRLYHKFEKLVLMWGIGGLVALSCRVGEMMWLG